MEGQMNPVGKLETKLIWGANHMKVDLGWKIRNTLRLSFLLGSFYFWLAKLFSKVTGIPTIRSELSITLFKANGMIIEYGVVSRRVITDTGVAFLVDDWDTGATEIANMNYHGCGIGTAGENQTDTALGNESTTILNPDSTRATGSKTQPSANQLRSIGTLTFDGSGAITEHGLLSQAATGGGVLWDRSVFSAINVANLDSIQFTYTATLSANG